MKKTLSILFASLILVSGMHLTVATHFCGGVAAASKVSFSGELASCGMENQNDSSPIQGNHFDTNCCDDEILTYSVDNSFSPSNSVVLEFFKSLVQNFYTPINLSHYSHSSDNILSTNVIPPGNLIANSVHLVNICIFRI